MENIETNEIAIEEKNIDAITDNNNSNKDYTIYNYLKEHPSAILVILTTTITVITFFAQVMTYFANRNQLIYWGIDDSYVTVTQNSMFFSAMMSIIYVITIAVLSLWLSATLDPYTEVKKFSYMCKSYIKIIKKELKQLNNSHVSQECAITEKNNKINEIHDIRKKTIRKERYSLIWNTIPIILVFFMVVCLSSYMQSYKMLDTIKGTLLLIITQIIIYFIIYNLMFIREKKKIKETIRAKEKIPTHISKEVLDLIDIKKQYPLYSIFDEEKGGISNITIITSTICMLVLCILLSISYAFFMLPVNHTTSNIKIVTIDNCPYAIVYRSENTYFFEKAEIDENKLIIDTHEQRIMTVDDISFSVCKFDDIIKK